MRVVEEENLDFEQVSNMLTDLREDFLRMSPSSGGSMLFKTALLAFPRLPLERAPDVIDGLQARSKELFVSMGLMIGEFHEMNDAPGLYNPDFKPLRTPVPALAVRYMVASDLPFLTDFKYDTAQRISFLEAFLRQDFNRGSAEAQAALAAARKEQFDLHADASST